MGEVLGLFASTHKKKMRFSVAVEDFYIENFCVLQLSVIETFLIKFVSWSVSSCKFLCGKIVSNNIC